MLLFRLYKSIKDFDALQGIFSSQIGTQSITKEALEAEARGDYTKALALYSDVSRENGHSCSFCYSDTKVRLEMRRKMGMRMVIGIAREKDEEEGEDWGGVSMNI